MRTRRISARIAWTLAALVAAAPLAAAATLPAEASAQVPPKRIIISLDKKQLWLLQGRDTIFTAPVAIGTGAMFQYEGRTWRFNTPRGVRTVIGKEMDPVWTVPDWGYLEKAAERGLEPVFLKRNDIVELGDGTHIEVRGDQVGRTNRYGNWWPFTPGVEIIFDGRIFVPPLHTAQRRVPLALGPYKLDLGNGYLIHGVHPYNEESIGTAASHGCIRMHNEDVEILYGLVAVGTRVEII
jgi:hypothetical protein